MTKPRKALIRSLAPRCGDAVSYRAVGWAERMPLVSTFGWIYGMDHYRMSPPAEQDARDMLKLGFSPVYVEQLVGGKVTGRWEERDCTGLANNDLSSWENRGDSA